MIKVNKDHIELEGTTITLVSELCVCIETMLTQGVLDEKLLNKAITTVLKKCASENRKEDDLSEQSDKEMKDIENSVNHLKNIVGDTFEIQKIEEIISTLKDIKSKVEEW